jgi:hypothetical protein
MQAVQLASSAARLRGIRAASAFGASGRTTHNPPAGRLTARRTASCLVFPDVPRPRCAAGHSGAGGHGIRRSDTAREGWRAARRPRATVSPMSVMPVPELPGALCRQHPDPDLWTSDMRSVQEEARRVCRICSELADCRAWTLAQPAYRMGCGHGGRDDPGRAFRRAPQAPPEALAGQARTGQARPGRAAPRPDQVSRPEAAAVRPPRSRWTRPPSSSRNSSAAASVNSSPPWGGPHGRRQAPRNGPASANPAPCASPQAVRVPGRRDQAILQP